MNATAIKETKETPVIVVLYAGGQNDALIKACSCECALDEACGCDGSYYCCGSDCDMCE